MAVDLDDDGVTRYEPGEMDVVRPVPGSTPTSKTDQVSAALAGFKCFGNEALAAALATRPTLIRGGDGKGGRGGRQNNHRGMPLPEREDDDGGGGAPWQRACGSRARGQMRPPPTAMTGDGQPRPRRIGCGPSGARALLGALNKLNERNFEPIRDRVASLVAAGDVSPRAAVRAVLAKSADESCFAHVYVRLLQEAGLVAALTPPVGATDVPLDGDTVGEGREAVREFLGALFGGDTLWTDVLHAAMLLGTCGPAPAEGTAAYDAFCGALKAKKRLLGRHKTALAILAAMARDVEGAPRPAEVVAVTLKVLGHAAGDEEDEETPLLGRAPPGAEATPLREAAVDLSLDLAAQVAEALSKPGAPTSHVAALAVMRAGAIEALPQAVLAECYGPRTRFKAQDLITMHVAGKTMASAAAASSAPQQVASMPGRKAGGATGTTHRGAGGSGRGAELPRGRTAGGGEPRVGDGVWRRR